MRRESPLLAGLLVAAGLALSAAASTVELYGRPLRGLSAVPVATVLASPERYADRSIRVAGTGRKGGDGLEIVDGDAALALAPSGFSLPDSALGLGWTAEGKLRVGGKGSPPVLVASGVEVAR
ncbi:hypothetical protein FBQ97_04990 [Acidobacteria bacterium ACD]|nr:MAG: hypothetical protein EDX89_13975 [Acidobacteriota bacterium]MCE7958896.1 hypothetical protein [Acidobacteria bacterium ACB2]MDL1949155.1 hypothetical protein [Acidobacteria bacterium ACD]